MSMRVSASVGVKVCWSESGVSGGGWKGEAVRRGGVHVPDAVLDVGASSNLFTGCSGGSVIRR